MLIKVHTSVLCLALSLFLISNNNSFAEDDLMLDMELEEPEEAPAPKHTLPPITISPVTQVKASAKKLISNAIAPTITPETKKTINKNIDLLTRIKQGMEFSTEEVERWAMGNDNINKCMEHGKTILIYLVSQHKDIEAVRFLIENGAELRTHCTPQYEALFVALTENSSLPMVETLINNNANVIAEDDEKNTALIIAATYNSNPKIISALLEYGLRINVKNKFGHDALTLAVYNNERLPIIQRLLDNSADINSRDNKGRTPLMAAAIRGNDAVMQYLIKRGADFNAKDNNDVSVLDYYNKHTYLQTLPHNISKFATPSERLEQEYDFITENHYKYNNMLKQSVFDENADSMVTEAIKNNADIDILTENGCTTLLNASRLNSPQNILEKLLNAGAKINATCENNQNALMLIISNADDKIPLIQQVQKIRYLAKKGIDINATDDEGNTALMYASIHKSAPGLVQALIENNADINKKNKSGETALMLAIKSEAPEKSILKLLEANADTNLADNSGETPLWYLLKNNGNATVVSDILAFGADITLPDVNGDTPIWYALNHNLDEATQIEVISAEENINYPNEHRDTPLLFALKNNYSPAIIQALLQKGADPQIRGKDGLNAYDILKSNKFFNQALQKRTRAHVLGEEN